MRVLGIDPGVATTGFGVVERIDGKIAPVELGVIRTPAGTPQETRLATLRAALAELIVRHRPDVVAVERLFFNNNVRTAMAVGQASGIALLAAAEAGLSVTTYTPSEVKQSVVGVGSASKHQVQAMIVVLLGLDAPPPSPDAADACALAICHLNRAGLSRGRSGPSDDRLPAWRSRRSNPGRMFRRRAWRGLQVELSHHHACRSAPGWRDRVLVDAPARSRGRTDAVRLRHREREKHVRGAPARCPGSGPRSRSTCARRSLRTSFGELWSRMTWRVSHRFRASGRRRHSGSSWI